MITSARWGGCRCCGLLAESESWSWAEARHRGQGTSRVTRNLPSDVCTNLVPASHNMWTNRPKKLHQIAVWCGVSSYFKEINYFLYCQSALPCFLLCLCFVSWVSILEHDSLYFVCNYFALMNKIGFYVAIICSIHVSSAIFLNKKIRYLLWNLFFKWTELVIV